MASQGKVPYPQPPKLNPKETDAEERYRKRLAAFEKLKEDIKNVKRYAVAKRVYCAIKKVRRKIRLPHCRLSSNRADFDSSCWRLNSKDQNELRLTSYAEGAKKRAPVALRILGKGALRGTIQLIKKLDVYELRVCREALCKPERTEGEIVGFDTGYTEVAALSNGAFVGKRLDQYMVNQVSRIVKSAAEVYDVKVRIETVGSAVNLETDQEISLRLQKIAEQVESVERVAYYNDIAASEDCTWLIKRVRDRGGKAGYFLFGCNHHGHLDILLFVNEEDSLPPLQQP
ncbi:MAG: hypothetical protein KH037_12210 [Burkholderiales bacterium]|nr:hypothetical protein [Burkholderiales bacterium]